MEHAQITDLIARGATFVINHSGGKDSQAMTSYLRRLVPAEQLVVVHAELPGVDWEGIPEHIEATAGGLPVHYCRAVKTFLEMVEHRGMFPSPKYRQCTSDLKRGPIERTIRGLGHKLIVNCMGLRAEESASRAKAEIFKFSAKNSKAGREWYDWLPIHTWSTVEVFKEIAAAGQEPHWAYKAGMTRLSCCFCIMASRQDLKTAASLRPELAREIAAVERKIDQTMMMPKDGKREFLDEIVAEELEAAEAPEVTTEAEPVTLAEKIIETPIISLQSYRDEHKILSIADRRSKSSNPMRMERQNATHSRKRDRRGDRRDHQHPRFLRQRARGSPRVRGRGRVCWRGGQDPPHRQLPRQRPLERFQESGWRQPQALLVRA